MCYYVIARDKSSRKNLGLFSLVILRAELPDDSAHRVKIWEIGKSEENG